MLRRLSPSFDHLARISDGHGVFEHALLDAPRKEHGYCVDDVARALIVTVREPRPSVRLTTLSENYLRFLEQAVTSEGLVHNRMSAHGVWTDRPAIGDWWGRAVSALGQAASHFAHPFTRARALHAFMRAGRRRSPDVRASSFAAIGAAEVLLAHPESDAARSLLEDCLDVIPRDARSDWDWPEARMRYANAALCEALIFGGEVLGHTTTRDRGLELLETLLEIETTNGRLSVTGSSGRVAGDRGPLWDQQAIEPAAIADACGRAHRITGDRRWADGIELAAAWFLGDNDTRVTMYDAGTGAGYDGLEPTGRNENRGAESTIAAISTLQWARAIDVDQW